MDINLKDLIQTLPFEFKVTPDSIEISEGISGKINGSLIMKGFVKRLTKKSLFLSFTLNGYMDYPCSRCLQEVKQEIDYKFDEEIEISNDNVVELDEYINDCLFINEPVKVLCEEDCKGLCPICGTNLNVSQCNCEQEEEIDPRFEKLKELLM